MGADRTIQPRLKIESRDRVFQRSNDDAQQKQQTKDHHVWIQLYYEREERVEIQDNPIDIGLAEIPNGNISGLARRLKENDMKNNLSHCDRSTIRVYPLGTKPPFNQDKALKVWDPIPSDSSGPQPLIVVAPPPPQQQADGEYSFDLGSLVHC